MIIYAHPSCGTPPPVLKDAHGVCMRRVREHYVYGIGQAAFLSVVHPDAVEIGDGWVAWMNDDGAEPETLERSLRWYTKMDAEDQDGKIWTVPMILNTDGRRSFQVAYDEDGLPRIPADRQLLLDYAQEARAVLVNHYRESTLKDLPMQACHKWASTFIASSNHVLPRTLGRLGILNDRLILETLMAVTGVDFNA